MHGRRRQRGLECLAAAGLWPCRAAPGPARPLHRTRRPGQAAGLCGLDAAGIEQSIRQRFGVRPALAAVNWLIQPRSPATACKPCVSPGDPAGPNRCHSSPSMTNLTDALHIPDTQSAPDERHLAIQRVGVKDVRYPLQLRWPVPCSPRRRCGRWTWPAGREEGHAHVALRGLAGRAGRAARRGPGAARAPCRRCWSSSARTKAASKRAFSFFLRKRAPVSGVQSLLDYQGRWIAETRGGVTPLWAEVGVPVKSLCPCSKEISDYGAHNQRSLVTIRVELLQPIEWHELVRFAEDEASARSGRCSSGRREVGHRARLREPQVRRGPGARRGAAAQCRCAHRALCGGRRELRVHPQPLSAYARIERRHQAQVEADPEHRQQPRQVGRVAWRSSSGAAGDRWCHWKASAPTTQAPGNQPPGPARASRPRPRAAAGADAAWRASERSAATMPSVTSASPRRQQERQASATGP
jgi:GTP cyclohydrolase I